MMAVSTLPASADTTTSLGDGSGEGSTPFTGLAQSPEANLFTGASSTRIPIEVPPGRGQMTPQLALEYSSNAGPSLFGYGWDLPLGRIERSTKFGVPGCTGPHTDDFVLTLPGGITAELVNDPPNSNYYRPKVEQAYLRAEKFESLNKWEVYDRAGNKYTFGEGSWDRVGSGSAFMTLNPDGTCLMTTTWALNHIEDPNGNELDIMYVRINNVLYPFYVWWGGHGGTGSYPYHINFLYEYRPPSDRMVSYRKSFRRQLEYRVKTIRVYPDTGETIRQYTLHYDDTPDGYLSHLASVEVTGRPTQTFVYTPSDVEPAAAPDLARPAQAADFLRVANGSAEVTQTVLEMNGDGLLDLVQTNGPHAGNGNWTVYYGEVDAEANTFGFSEPGTEWRTPPGGGWGVLRNVQLSSCGLEWACTLWDTFDITGDGIADLVLAGGPQWKVYPGPLDGVSEFYPGFGDEMPWAVPSAFSHAIRQVHKEQGEPLETIQDVIDVNADGLPDLVISNWGQAAP